MAEIKAKLSQKDEKYRDFALNDNMWKVMLKVSIPLALYQFLNMMFKFLDTMMASHISREAVSAVAFISQISLLIGALGGGLAIGAGMKISEAYGAGDYEIVKKRVSSVYALCIFLGAVILGILVPFAAGFLKISGTPDSLVAIGTAYFRVELLATVLSFFNTIYVSIERARGNTGRILYINIIISVVKLVFTALFVYVLHGDVITIAWATVISQAVMFIFSIINMQGKDNAFGFSFKAISFTRDASGILITKSFPVIIEKMAFSFGKMIINSMSVVYGDITVGALGISNNIGGLATSLENGFQEGGASIISQNIGAGNKTRALDAFKKCLIINVIVGAVFMALTLIFIDPLCTLFGGKDVEFNELIKSIYSYEALGAVTLGVNAAVMALLYGFGLTKLTLVINFSRVFIFRVPVLWFLQKFTEYGSQSVGIVMMVSNVSIGICSALAAVAVVRKIKNLEL